uniref:Pirin n=1 Tax=Salmo trutta TaxID=8032 RepID=A0A674D7P9_SALTR
MIRRVVKTVLSVEQVEGVGAHVRRSIGRKELINLDPFLMLDEFKVKKPSGFPDHPHRGFETVTYVLKGVSAHEDFCGHSGLLKPGDLQWMTAGRGVVHAEMPVSEEPVQGLQLWVNLRREDKMVEPQYQELKDSQVPKPSREGVTVAVISGQALGVQVRSTILTITITLGVQVRSTILTITLGVQVRSTILTITQGVQVRSTILTITLGVQVRSTILTITLGVQVRSTILTITLGVQVRSTILTITITLGVQVRSTILTITLVYRSGAPY